jgi:hypothetical protein
MMSASLRSSIKWAFLANQYERQVLSLPSTPNGELKHVEWVGWGWPGAGNTVVYLVSDPSNSLASASDGVGLGKLRGLPCEVYRVHQMSSGWYTVEFYTGTTWNECSADGSAPHASLT